ncbi:MAG: hypothetical protein ACPG9K_00980 [Poseidonibacter sp.]
MKILISPERFIVKLPEDKEERNEFIFALLSHYMPPNWNAWILNGKLNFKDAELNYDYVFRSNSDILRSSVEYHIKFKEQRFKLEEEFDYKDFIIEKKVNFDISKGWELL